MVLSKSDSIVCFAQSKPVLQSPKNNKRDSRLFVTFRPGEKIVDEISITAGYEFNKQNQESSDTNLIFHNKILHGLQIIKLKEK